MKSLRRRLPRVLATLALVLLLAGAFWAVRGFAMAGPGNDEQEVSALEVWLGENLLVLPIVFGVLLGVVVGGYARRPVRTGAAIMGLFAFMIVLLVAVMIGMAAQAGGDGFVLFGTVGIAIGAVITLVVVLPSFVIALAAMKSLAEVDTTQTDQPG